MPPCLLGLHALPLQSRENSASPLKLSLFSANSIVYLNQALSQLSGTSQSLLTAQGKRKLMLDIL